jgi:hypothetical protein
MGKITYKMAQLHTTHLKELQNLHTLNRGEGRKANAEGRRTG